MQELFDFTSLRTKDDLKELEDMFLWIKYLYLNRAHSIKVQRNTLKMDSNFNLVWVMKCRQPDGTYKEDFNHSICANSLTYKELLDITYELKKDEKMWDSIKFSVSACSAINEPRK